MGQQLAVPQVLVVIQIAWMATQVAFDFFPRAFINPPGPALALTLPQATETTLFKAMNPTLDSGCMFAKPFSNRVATMPLAYQENSVKPVVVAGFVGAAYLLLNRDSHGLCIRNAKSFHARSLPGCQPQCKDNILHYL